MGNNQPVYQFNDNTLNKNFSFVHPNDQLNQKNDNAYDGQKKDGFGQQDINHNHQ